MKAIYFIYLKTTKDKTFRVFDLTEMAHAVRIVSAQRYENTPCMQNSLQNWVNDSNAKDPNLGLKIELRLYKRKAVWQSK